MTNPLEKFLSKQVVKTPDGEKIYTFRLLRQREAARVFHETVSVLLSALAQAMSGDESKPMAKLDAIKALDFDTFWSLASTLLRDCIIRPRADTPDFFITVTDLNACEYFDDAREELYIAVWYALQANYPKSWARLERAAQGFGQKVAALMAGTPQTTASEPPK